MVVPLAEVTFCDTDLATGTVAELYACVSTSVVGTDELLTMLYCFGDDEVGSLFERMIALHVYMYVE